MTAAPLARAGHRLGGLAMPDLLTTARAAGLGTAAGGRAGLSSGFTAVQEIIPAGATRSAAPAPVAAARIATMAGDAEPSGSAFTPPRTRLGAPVRRTLNALVAGSTVPGAARSDVRSAVAPSATALGNSAASVLAGPRSDGPAAGHAASGSDRMPAPRSARTGPAPTIARHLVPAPPPVSIRRTPVEAPAAGRMRTPDPAPRVPAVARRSGTPAVASHPSAFAPAHPMSRSELRRSLLESHPGLFRTSREQPTIRRSPGSAGDDVIPHTDDPSGTTIPGPWPMPTPHHDAGADLGDVFDDDGGGSRRAELAPADMDEIVERVVDRIEQRVVDELERRGRRHTPGVF